LKHFSGVNSILTTGATFIENVDELNAVFVSRQYQELPDLLDTLNFIVRQCIQVMPKIDLLLTQHRKPFRRSSKVLRRLLKTGHPTIGAIVMSIVAIFNCYLAAHALYSSLFPTGRIVVTILRVGFFDGAFRRALVA
jgi:hypothetical protein